MSSRPRRKTAAKPPASAKRAAAGRAGARRKTPRRASRAVAPRPLTTPTPADSIAPIAGTPPRIDDGRGGEA